MELKLSLELQEPIVFNKIIIYQPTLQDIIDYGFDEFNELLVPFIFDKSMLQMSEEIEDKISMFDVFINEDIEHNKLLSAIEFFCKPKDKMEIKEDKTIKIDNGLLTRDNFEEFANIILKICSRSKPKVEKPPVFKNEKQKDIWTKLHKGRERQNNSSQLYLYDLIKVVEIGGKNYIPIKEIKKMTMWKITDLYTAILNKDSYETNFEVFLVSGDKKLIDKHWTEELKI